MHNLPTPTSLIQAVYHSIDTFAIKLSQQSFEAAHKFAKPLFWQHKNNANDYASSPLQHFCNKRESTTPNSPQRSHRLPYMRCLIISYILLADVKGIPLPVNTNTCPQNDSSPRKPFQKIHPRRHFYQGQTCHLQRRCTLSFDQ